MGLKDAWEVVDEMDEPDPEKFNDEMPVHTVEITKPFLLNMLGNLWEWTSDWYSRSTYNNGNRINPIGPSKGRSKVRRGGSFHCPLYQVRPGYRAANQTDVIYSVLGIRIVAMH